eukprot:m.48593 g.48593  ORF g.48593 m.48593 type:complete len:303 (+) comp8923_c0_seq1:994-1902(+)
MYVRCFWRLHTSPRREFVVWFTRYSSANATEPCLGVCVDGSTSPACHTTPPGQPKPLSNALPPMTFMSWTNDPLSQWSTPVVIYNGTDGSNGNVTTGDTNLAPVIYPNGSLVGLWRGIFPDIPGVQARGMGIYTVRATNWKDPTSYDFGHAALKNSIMGITTPSGGVYLDEEDPHVWLDAKGRLHAVVHMFQLGGHLASDDGGYHWRWYGPITSPPGNGTDEENWHKSLWWPRCPAIATDDGSASTTELCFQRRERPHIIFDSKGLIMVVGTSATSPVSPGEHGDSCWTVIQPTVLWHKSPV